MLSGKIAVNGDLGSGKSRLAQLLATELGAAYVSSGQLQRSLARQAGMSTLDLNLQADANPAIDRRIDAALEALNDEPGPMVVDSRLAFFFVRPSTSIHLLAAPETAAARITAGRDDTAEFYADEAEAVRKLTLRRQSERARFQRVYGVRIDRLKNYDLVIQTDLCGAKDVFDAAIRFLAKPDRKEEHDHPTVLLNPRAVFPTSSVRHALRSPVEEAAGDEEPITVCNVGGMFFAVDGHRRLAVACRDERHLIRARLCAQDGDDVGFGISAERLVRTGLTPSALYDWEDALGFRFARYPLHLIGAQTQLASMAARWRMAAPARAW